MTLAITALYAGLLGLMLVVLSFRIAQRRLKFRIGLGTGNNPELEQAIRVHGNFIEYVPLTLVLMALLEADGAPGWALHAAGVVLVLARLLHATGLTQSSGRTPWRFSGTIATWTLIAVLSVANVVRFAL
jgi:uncharacterized membrane protein YecN with MAPEG domain